MKALEEILDDYTDRILAGIEYWKVVPRDEMMFYLGELMNEVIKIVTTPMKENMIRANEKKGK